MLPERHQDDARDQAGNEEVAAADEPVEQRTGHGGIDGRVDGRRGQEPETDDGAEDEPVGDRLNPERVDQYREGQYCDEAADGRTGDEEGSYFTRWSALPAQRRGLGFSEDDGEPESSRDDERRCSRNDGEPAQL